MDALTFETPRLLRNVTMAGDNPIKEIDYKKARIYDDICV